MSNTAVAKDVTTVRLRMPIDVMMHRLWGGIEIDAAVHENGNAKELMLVTLQRDVKMAFAVMESWYTLLALRRKRNVVNHIERANSQEADRKKTLQS